MPLLPRNVLPNAPLASAAENQQQPAILVRIFYCNCMFMHRWYSALVHMQITLANNWSCCLTKVSVWNCSKFALLWHAANVLRTPRWRNWAKTTVSSGTCSVGIIVACLLATNRCWQSSNCCCLLLSAVVYRHIWRPSIESPVCKLLNHHTTTTLLSIILSCVAAGCLDFLRVHMCLSCFTALFELYNSLTNIASQLHGQVALCGIYKRM